MKLRSILLSGAFLNLCVFAYSPAHAEQSHGLVINASEIGIGKFHRYDNKQHKYEENNLWLDYVLPDGASTKTPLVQNNKDGSVTIFFSNLEELLKQIKQVSDDSKAKVEVLNIEAHGMPGAMWFPEDEAAMNGLSCADWMQAAQGDDKGNYDQYYSPVSHFDIILFRLMSKLPSMQFMAPCTTGANQWKEVIERNPDVVKAFAPDLQLHFFSCIVGLGWSGSRFTSNIASLLSTGNNSKVEASMNFGLGDWSMPEGMGFWDYQNSDQLAKDNAKYPVDRKDRELMQKGQIRLTMNSNGNWQTGIVSDLDFMLGTKDSLQLPNSLRLMADKFNLTGANAAEEEKGLSFAEVTQVLKVLKTHELHIPGTHQVVHFVP